MIAPTHIGNKLLVDDTPYKSMFDEQYNAIILESFDGFCGEDHYFLGNVFPYLEFLHFFQNNVFECSHVNGSQKQL